MAHGLLLEPLGMRVLRVLKWILASPFLFGLLLGSGLLGCGDQKFRAVTSTVSTESPGAYFVPPKVDIVMAEDDTGSMKEAYGPIASQLPGFLQGLENQRWDYRFVTTPLTTSRELSQIAAGRYDPNWGSSWIAPYPGANVNQVPKVLSSFFRSLDRYTHFLTLNDVNNSLGGSEPGLETLDLALHVEAPKVDLLRPDAMLVLLVVGNGEDTSRVNYCRRSDGVWIVCNDGSEPSSRAYYLDRLKSLKSGSGQVRFYSAVSNYQRSSCLGGAAYAGTRYRYMAEQLGGAVYDVCTTPIANVLSGISEHLKAQKMVFRTRYLFLAQEPDPASIKVTKYLGGTKNGAIAMPQSSTNGWTYVGKLKAHAIDYPAKMNEQDGYAIELHGASKLIGDDTADIEFMPKGL